MCPRLLASHRLAPRYARTACGTVWEGCVFNLKGLPHPLAARVCPRFLFPVHKLRRMRFTAPASVRGAVPEHGTLRVVTAPRFRTCVARATGPRPRSPCFGGPTVPTLLLVPARVRVGALCAGVSLHECSFIPRPPPRSPGGRSGCLAVPLPWRRMRPAGSGCRRRTTGCARAWNSWAQRIGSGSVRSTWTRSAPTCSVCTGGRRCARLSPTRTMHSGGRARVVFAASSCSCRRGDVIRRV